LRFTISESNFGSNLGRGTTILHISRVVTIKIIGIDPANAIVEDLAVAIIHNGFNTLMVVWLKLKNEIKGTWVELTRFEAIHFFLSTLVKSC
jgi:hypothetical protein